MNPAVNLRFILPVLTGQRILLLDNGCLFGEATETGDWLSVDAGSLANLPDDLPENYVDHLILPRLSHSHRSWLEGIRPAIRRTLRPGGWLLLGMQHAGSLQYLTKRSGDGFRQSHVRSLLKRCGFIEQHWYGVVGNMRQPNYMVPLDRAALSRHFFETMYVPYSPQASWLPHLAKLFIFLGLQHVLYLDLMVAARLPVGGEGR